MQKVLTAEQMRTVDRLTTERYGIPSIILMENAAHAVARVITEKLGGSVRGKSILILCGKGNNGGDGAAVARLLNSEGASVKVIIFAKIEQTKGDARTNFERLSNVELCEAEEWYEAWEYINREDWNGLSCVVDAVFGTGLKGFRDDLNEIIGSFPAILHFAVDIPSGLSADDPAVQPSQYKADITVTFTTPKPANILPPASYFNGELIVADIGSPQELIDEQPSQLYLAEKEDAAKWVENTAFSSDSYKNKRGHALLIAGSDDYTGAAVLCGNAAIRSGVGLVTMCVPDYCKVEVASRCLPEVIVRSINENTNGDVSDEAFDENHDVINAADAIALGCGLSATDKGVEKFVREIVEERTKPVIIDAGALWFFNPPAGLLQMPSGVSSPHVSKGSSETSATSTEANWPPAHAGGSDLILTPHEGEFLRLLGTDDKDVIKDRVAAVRDFATKHNVILVLKGERVLIGAPDGRVVVNPTGNSGLGKAGNGDTLTGILAGFTAQAVKFNIDIFETVVAAVYVAGMAGDIAEQKYGKRVMTASDVRECLTAVFEQLEKN